MSKAIKFLTLSILMGLFSFSCTKKDTDLNKVEVTGVIQQQGITTYQYGTHVMGGYALRSETFNLDDYIGQSITVVGYKIEGYPVENGPDYLEVEKIK